MSATPEKEPLPGEWNEKCDSLRKLIITKIIRRDRVLPAVINFIVDKNGNLINLKELDLANNGINELPNNIGKLTKLKKLKLQNNNLKEIPSSLARAITLWLLACTQSTCSRPSVR